MGLMRTRDTGDVLASSVAVVADAVQGPAGVLIPASALRSLPNARFYVTLGAARRLQERQVELLGGAASREKRLRISGASSEAVAAFLRRIG